MVLVTGAIGSAATAAREAGTVPSTDAKKKCKIVKKRVHGHIKKVRVCTKPKPKPKPSLPSKVTVTLDSAHATTASIGADAGATLTAGAATLTVPAGAVAQTTTVTMTPVTKLGGLKGTIAGAFELKPDGLQLLKPVTLTIDVPSTRVKAFTYAGNGTDFHLYPLKVAGGKATLDLIHFSGYGVGEGLPQPAVARVRQFMTRDVKPLIAQAKGDSRYFAVAALRTWELLLEMAALPTDDFVELYPDFQAVQADLGVALRKLADDQHQKCAETHDIVGTSKEVEYTLILVVPLLFIKSQPLADAVSYARTQVAKCKSFELDFDSTITYDFDDLGQDVTHVHVLRLKLNADNNWTNEAPLEYVSAGVHPGDCGSPSISTRPGAPFTATLRPDWDSNPPKIPMDVFPGTAFEILDWDCPAPFGHQHLETSSWSGGFFLLHPPPVTIDDWSYLGGSVIARKTYSRSTFNISESTTFELRHTPQ